MMTTYAVNVFDLACADPIVRMLLAPAIQSKHTVDGVEPGKVVDAAVILDCDEERAEAIIQIVRVRLKPGQLRFYRSNTGNGGWKRVKR